MQITPNVNTTMPATHAVIPQAVSNPVPQAITGTPLNTLGQGQLKQQIQTQPLNQATSPEMFKTVLKAFLSLIMGNTSNTSKPSTPGGNVSIANAPGNSLTQNTLQPSSAAKQGKGTVAPASGVAPTSGGGGNAMETSILNQINSYRQTKGLPPLVADPQLSAAARARSGDQAQKQKMSHDGFQESVKDLGLRGSAENVAMNKGVGDPASQSVQGWINSPGHHKNLTGDYTKTGIGVVQGADGAYYFTQLFGK